MAPRRPARRTSRPALRRTTRKPRTRPRLTTLQVACLTGSVLLAASTPAIGIPLLILVGGALWYSHPSRRAKLRQIRRPAVRTAVRPMPQTTPRTVSYTALSPAQFEQALAELCRRDGCTNVRVVGGAGDLAADVIATTPDGRRMVIQAKRYGPKSTVGSGDVQKVNGTYRDVHHGQLAAIVTTSRFTQPALDLARRVGIRTYDQHALAGWASRTGPAPWQ